MGIWGEKNELRFFAKTYEDRCHSEVLTLFEAYVLECFSLSGFEIFLPSQSIFL